MASILTKLTLALGALTFMAPVMAQTPLKDIQAKGLKPLNGEELQKLIPGNTLFHLNPANGVRVPLYYAPDGNRLVRIRGQVIPSKWRLEGDRICEYSVVLKKDVCRSLYRVEGAGVLCEDGNDTCEYGWDWAAGNAEKLGM